MVTLLSFFFPSEKRSTLKLNFFSEGYTGKQSQKSHPMHVKMAKKKKKIKKIKNKNQVYQILEDIFCRFHIHGLCWRSTYFFFQLLRQH